MTFYILHFTFYILFAFFAWRRLNWAVLLAIAALPSYLIRFQIGPVPMTLLEGMVIIIFATWFFRSNSKFRTLVIGHWSLVIPIGLFLLAATIGMFVAPDLRAAAGIWKAYFIEPVLFFLVLIDLLQRKHKINNPYFKSSKVGHWSLGFEISVSQIVSALSITALFLSIYAIYQRFTGFGIPPPWDVERRVTSIFSYPNALGLFLAPLVPLFVARVFTTGKLLAISYWLIVIIASILAIIFAKSTGALVGIAAGLLFLIYFLMRVKTHDREFSPAKKYYILHITYYVIIIGVLITILLSLPNIRNELLLKDWSGHVRRTQWSETITMLKDRPIFGAGLAGYKETLAPYHKATYLEIFEYPHNIVLNFWSETGMLGFIAFAWLVVIFFRKILNSVCNPSQPPLNLRGGDQSISPLKIRGGKGSYESAILGAAAAMIALLIHGLVDVPYFKNDLAILFWIVYAIGLNNNHTSYE